MKNPYLISSILRGVWAIDPVSAEGFYPLVHNLLLGKYTDTATTVTEPIKVAMHSRSYSDNTQNQDKDGVVAVIPLKGVVTKNDQFCGPEGTETLSQRIKQAAANPQVAAIVIDVDTPGGEGGACLLPSQAIREARNSKPVLAYVGNGMCASAGYFISSNTDEIYATFDTDQIGSIGTYITLADFKSYYKKEGLPIHEVYATKSTNKNRLYRDALNGKYDELRKRDIDPFNQVFLNTVMENRGIESDSEALTGKLYYANDAIEIGLIDGLKSFDEVIDRAFELAENYQPTNTKNNSKSNNSNNMFGKFKALSAFAKTNAEERTPEQLDAVNQELQANGISGFLMEATEDLNSAADVNQAIANAATQVNTANNERNTAQAEVTRLEGELDASNARITELENESTGASRQGAKNPDEKKTGMSDQQLIDSLPHNIKADELLNP